MNYIYVLSFVFVVSLAFGRVSGKYHVSDDGISFSNRQPVSEVSSGTSSDDSLKWKRRHKKRKKSRRPQRGR